MWQDFIMVNRLKCMHLIPWRYWRQAVSAHGRRRRDPVTRFQNPKLYPGTEQRQWVMQMQRPWRNERKWSCCCPLRVYFGIWIWAQVDEFCDAKIETRKSVNPHNNNLRWFTNSAEGETDQTFWFLPATQDDRKREFFMSDFELTASAESGPDRHTMLLDNVENL